MSAVGQPLVLGALVSGTGRSVLNLQEAIQSGALRARLAVVVALRPDVPAVEKCQQHGLTVVVVPPEPAHTLDDRLDAVLRQHGVQVVCLCGYLRKFRVGAWAGRAVNIHPALLPAFGGKGMYGQRVHEAVLAAGVPESGCTVHLVDDEYDHGPTLLQLRCPVLPADTPQTLAARVFALECQAYPAAIEKLVPGTPVPTFHRR